MKEFKLCSKEALIISVKLSRTNYDEIAEEVKKIPFASMKLNPAIFVIIVRVKPVSEVVNIYQ